MKSNEAKLLEYLDDYGLDIFSKGDLIKENSLSPKQIETGLRSLIKRGLVKIIERGKYCRHNFRDENVLGNFLVKDGGIGYWSAMHYHGLTEQIPNVVFVQTSRKKKDKSIFGVKYKFIQVKKAKITGYKTEGYGNYQFKISDIEKTIVDCFDLSQHSGGYPEIIKAFARADISARKMVTYCKAIDNIAVVKRLAYLTELLGKKNMDYFKEYALSIRNDKYNLFEHNGDANGKSTRKWRLVLNMEQAEILNIARS